MMSIFKKLLPERQPATLANAAATVADLEARLENNKLAIARKEKELDDLYEAAAIGEKNGQAISAARRQIENLQGEAGGLQRVIDKALAELPIMAKAELDKARVKADKLKEQVVAAENKEAEDIAAALIRYLKALAVTLGPRGYLPSPDHPSHIHSGLLADFPKDLALPVNRRQEVNEALATAYEEAAASGSFAIRQEMEAIHQFINRPAPDKKAVEDALGAARAAAKAQSPGAE